MLLRDKIKIVFSTLAFCIIIAFFSVIYYNFQLQAKEKLEKVESFKIQKPDFEHESHQQFLDAAKNLKFIGRVGAGLENIDCDYAESKGITLISAPEGNRNAVGEHSLAMLLSLFNKLNKADNEVRNGKWLREDNRGIELDGKTIGLIGYGNMGKAFAKKLCGFDVNVLCYDIKDDVGDKNANQVSLETLQEKADVLSLHTPETPFTIGMINQNFIKKFKNNLIFKKSLTCKLYPKIKRKKFCWI